MCVCVCVSCAFTVATILLCIGVVTSIVIFPLGIAALILYCIKYKGGSAERVMYIVHVQVFVYTYTLTPPPTVRCVVISFGITGSVIVFPIGLVLLFVAYCCCHGKESDDRPHQEFQDRKFLLSLLACLPLFTCIIASCICVYVWSE